MRVLMFSILLTMVVFSLSACPGGEEEINGAAPSDGGAVAPPPTPPPAAYLTSSLASMGDFKLGMSSDDVKALFPEDGDYSLGEAFPPEGVPVMVSASPKEGAEGREKMFGFLDGELVFYSEGGASDEAGYDAWVSELTATYGDPSEEAPAILEASKFFSGSDDEESGETSLSEDTPENAMFWVDANANVVMFSGMDEGGDAGVVLLLTDKVDAYFDAMDAAIEEMMPDAMAGLGEAMGEVEGAEAPGEEEDGEEEAAADEEGGEDEEAHEDDEGESEHPVEHPS